MEQFSIAEARNRFTEVVRRAERGEPVRLFRRGKAVAVVLSIRDYQRLVKPGDFWTPLARFREQIERGEREGVEPDVFAGVRDRSPGRNAAL
jgi:prevent-host-death family protein